MEFRRQNNWLKLCMSTLGTASKRSLYSRWDNKTSSKSWILGLVLKLLLVHQGRVKGHWQMQYKWNWNRNWCTCKRRGTTSLTSPLFLTLLYIIWRPPSHKSIFIFAVLTFSSFCQRHNEGFLQLHRPAPVKPKQTKHNEGKKPLFISTFLPFRQSIPYKANGHHFWSNTSTNVAIGEASTLSVNVL